MSALWIGTIAAAVGCFLLKLLGTAMPESLLDHPMVQAVARYLPVAMLSALIVTELAAGDGCGSVSWWCSWWRSWSPRCCAWSPDPRARPARVPGSAVAWSGRARRVKK